MVIVLIVIPIVKHVQAQAPIVRAVPMDTISRRYQLHVLNVIQVVYGVVVPWLPNALPAQQVKP